MFTRRLLIILLAALVFSGPEARAANWTRLRTAHFTLEGDVGERELREVAWRLERFCETIGQKFPSAQLVTSAPVTVLVFGRASDIKAVAPRFEGKPVELAGYATSSPIGPSIAICIERRDQAYPIAYHELTHLLISNAMLGLPLWLREGLAEFYGTFELSDDGRRAVLGKAVAPEKIRLLREGLLPMSELLAADEGSRLYNVGADRGLFYAQSWALVHYLLLDNPNRGRQFISFIQRLATGVPAATAFTESFPNADRLESELRAFVTQLTLRTYPFTLADRAAGDSEYTVTRMTPAETMASLGLDLARQGRFAEAQARFEQALKIAPGTASAQTGLGVVFTMQGRIVDALPALRKGAELADGEAMAHFAFGYGALECISPDCLGEQGARETARREFQRAVDLLPQFPDALSLLGWTEATSGGDLASAERHLLQAIAFLPGREDYRFNLAQIYLRQENEAKVQQILGPIAAASPSAGNRTRARQMLASLATARAARQARQAAQADALVSPAGGTTPPAAPASDSPSTGPGLLRNFRRIGQGEQRAEGTLTTIECSRGSIVVVIRDGAVSHRFSAPSLDAIDFIAYRDDLRGSISCGPQAGAMRVYLTWRPPAPGEPTLPAGTEGRVVAIEYLPVK